MRRPHITVVNYYFIFPVDNGGKIAIQDYYAALSEWFDITIVNIAGYANIYKDEIKINEHVKVVTLSSQKTRSQLNEVALQYDIPPWSDPACTIMTVRQCKESFFAEQLREITKYSDIIITEHVYAYRLAKAVSEGKLFLYRAQNVEYDYKKDDWKVYNNLPETIYGEIYDLEKECCCECDLILTITNDDAQRFQKLYGVSPSKMLNISAGYDARNVEPVTRGEKVTESNRISGMFISSPASVAVEAAKTIIAAARKLPDITFNIAGGVGSKLNNEDIPDNVNVLGGITEEQKLNLLEASDFALNPIVGGSGLNIKMLEYFAAGLPVVCTKFAMRGIDGEDKIHCLMTDIENLAETIRSFCDLPMSERDKIAKNAYELYQKSHTWGSCALKTVSRLQELMHIDLQAGVVPADELKLIDYPEVPGFIPDENVYIYGSGHYGTTCLNSLSRLKITPLAFLDRDKAKWGTKIKEIPVQASTSFLENSDNYYVIFALEDFGSAVKDLLSSGLKPERVVIAHNGTQLIHPVSGKGVPFYVDTKKLKSAVGGIM